MNGQGGRGGARVFYKELPKLKKDDWDGWYHHTTYACTLCGAEQKEWWVNKGDHLQPDCWSFPLMSKVFKEHYLESHPESIKIHGRPGSYWVEYSDGDGYTRIEQGAT